MLLIRREQMDVFSAQSRLLFERRLTSHFVATYPRETSQAGGPAQIRRVVEEGVKRAASFGFEAADELTLFVALLFMLGCDFDSDPQLPWVRALLSEGHPQNSRQRIEALYDAAVDYLSATAGESCEYVVRALLRIRDFDPQDAPRSEGEQFFTEYLALLNRFCPEKSQHQGEVLNRQLIAWGRERANQYGITHYRGVYVMITLMFMLGGGIDHDLLHPWVQQALTDPGVPDEEARVERLYVAALAHTELSLQSDEKFGTDLVHGF